MRETSACCLTIAGSDSGGNAGIQADLRAFHAYGLHGCTVFAALTAQNPFGVNAIHPVPADFVAAQLDAVLGVYDIRALKTGMLSDPAAIDVICERLAVHPEIAKVVDPVMIATSGAKLISEAAIKAIRAKLLPLATLITPNLPEAAVLADSESANGVDLAKCLHETYGCSVLVKGGHGTSAQAVDVLCIDGRIEEFSLPRIEHPISTHGTGCTMAAALAAGLALGNSISTAVSDAKAHVYAAISGSHWVGPNCGVLGFVPPRKV